MTTDVSPRGVQGGGKPPRTRGAPGGRPPGLALLRAAEELFGERSYHRTTVADICVRAAQIAHEVDARYDPEVIAFAYTGIGNFVGMRWADWTAGGRVPDDILDDVLEFLSRGLAPRDSGAARPEPTGVDNPVEGVLTMCACLGKLFRGQARAA